ncbi:probable palmitoyltransferase ZDHHC24 isoform X1 [Teleopsis dalmanni]|uniref:probable palmitoyltransferase ZDHHC24 isoform X1 n=1 Tax=Teleopsis dalmanni TaxID=139649 RepID=UPI0018CE6340|nr:probable palmitoyltransferase ZDHHC24 isoform X1 [Teleopsis dalmanni]
MFGLLKELLPRRISDILCLFVIVLFLPIVFLFEMGVVLPAVHMKGSFLHNITFMLAMFIMSNLKGNMLACAMTDTSVDHKKVMPPENAVTEAGWHNCDKCNNISPPRSWHCDICKCCILKRDHHCPFTSCCVGHKNQRYFLMFVCYLFLGSLYAFAYNTYYIWVLKGDVYRNWYTVLKMSGPFMVVITGFSRNDVYLFFYSLNILALIYSLALLIHHGRNVLSGDVCYNSGSNMYDEGWKQNLKTIFGERMHLVWISPLISSKLEHDGLQWKPKTN